MAKSKAKNRSIKKAKKQDQFKITKPSKMEQLLIEEEAFGVPCPYFGKNRDLYNTFYHGRIQECPFSTYRRCGECPCLIHIQRQYPKDPNAFDKLMKLLDEAPKKYDTPEKFNDWMEND